MAVRQRVHGRIKSAHHVLGRWTWIGSHGELLSYPDLPHLIAAAAREGWQFDHRTGTVGIFCES